MSKTNLLIKKTNALTPIATRVPHNIPNIKTLTYREPHSQHSNNAKLYTFCSSGNKPAEQQNRPNQQNQLAQNTAKQRKVSVNSTKNHLLQQNHRSKGKIPNHLNICKDKTKLPNKYCMLNQSNVIDRRRSQKPNSSKVLDKKINISICINRNGLKGNQQIIDLNEGDDFIDNQKDIKSASKQTFSLKHQNIGVTKQGWHILNQGGRRKVVIDEEQLSKFTHKFACQKYKLQQIIDDCNQNIAKYKERQSELLQIKNDSEDYINFLQAQKKDFISSTAKLQQTIQQLQSDRQFYIMAKQEYRKTIKQHEEQIACLQKQINHLNEQLKAKQDKRTIGQSSSYHELEQLFLNELKIMQIENNFLRRQLQLSQSYRKINQSTEQRMQSKVQHSQQISLLLQKNSYLNNELKRMGTVKMENEVNRKLIQQCTLSMAKLQEQNQKLRKQIFSSSNSVQQSLQLSEFKFKLDSSRHKDDCSPSQVQIIWKRESPDFASSRQSESVAVKGYFDHDFFTELHKN